MLYEKQLTLIYFLSKFLSSSDKLCVPLKNDLWSFVFGSSHFNVFIRYLNEGIKPYFLHKIIGDGMEARNDLNGLECWAFTKWQVRWSKAARAKETIYKVIPLV